MLHFIPAWYQGDSWSENEQKWYVRREHTEFDDTVKQMQLFHRNQVYPYQIMLLGFTPNFRHFLHRQSVYHAPYWSCFDAIQEIRRKKAAILSFHNLNWPEHVEFVYTPFVIMAMLSGKKYAKLEFGEDGNLIQIDMYQNDIICRRNLYDDRGFVSSSIVYDEGKPIYQDYLMESGTIKMRVFVLDGHVEVNASCPQYLLQFQNQCSSHNLLKLRYDSLQEVIHEVLEAYLKLTDQRDMFCVAMHHRHTQLLYKALADRKMILSFFENRYDITQYTEAVETIRRADYIIADSGDSAEFIREYTGILPNRIKDITPYDSRVDFGISQQLTVQKILVPIDGMEDCLFGEIIGYLVTYLIENNRAEIHLFTRQAAYDAEDRILEKTAEYLKMAGFEENWARVKNKGADRAENRIDQEQDGKPIRFCVDQCVDELTVSKCMREQRLILDIRKVRDLYLRIAAISGGIPQIVHMESKYIEDGKNGIVLKDIVTIPQALAYYLDSLKNWNEAMIHAYELGKNFTTEVLLNEWREVIEFIG